MTGQEFNAATLGDAVSYDGRTFEVVDIVPDLGLLELVCTQWPWCGERAHCVGYDEVTMISYCKEIEP